MLYMHLHIALMTKQGNMKAGVCFSEVGSWLLFTELSHFSLAWNI